MQSRSVVVDLPRLVNRGRTKPAQTRLRLAAALMGGCVLAAQVTPPLAAEASSARPELRPGQSAITNDLVVQCLSDRVRVVPSDAAVAGNSQNPSDSRPGLPVYESRGPLQSSYADCRLGDGTTVRVKSGQISEPMAYGQCGAAPGEKLSVWVDRRKVASSFGYASFCEDMTITSLVIRRSSAKVCIPPLSSESLHVDGFGDLRARGLDDMGCAELPLVHPAKIDTQEFPGNGHKPPEVDALTLEALPAMRAICRQLLPKESGGDPAVPEILPQPSWQTQQVALKQPNTEHLGFNATTLSANGTVGSATFDLENTGNSHRIYMLDSSNHWFDGTALAIDAGGILTVPFDAHDEAASIRKGIHVWVYDHAQVFFGRGQTYILLNPVNHEYDSRVLALHGGREEQVCTFRRVRERF